MSTAERSPRPAFHPIRIALSPLIITVVMNEPLKSVPGIALNLYIDLRGVCFYDPHLLVCGGGRGIRHREVKQRSQDYTGSKWRSQAENPGSVVLTTRCCCLKRQVFQGGLHLVLHTSFITRQKACQAETGKRVANSLWQKETAGKEQNEEGGGVGGWSSFFWSKEVFSEKRRFPRVGLNYCRANKWAIKAAG